MNKILVVNVNWLGDAVFSTPLFKALRANYPTAHIACLCVPRVKKVLEFCPFIDEIIVYDDKGTHFWPWGKWSLVTQLRKKSFDAAFILHRSLTRSLMAYLAGIPKRIGYCKNKNLLTFPVELPNEDTHRSDVYLKILEAYGLVIKDRSCQLDLKIQDAEELDKLLESKGISPDEPFIVMHVTGNWDLKRWPPFHFVKLIDEIAAQMKYKVVLSGGKGDIEYCQSVSQQAHHKAVVMAGETSLGQSLALYQRAMVMISSDSGPLHLADSVGANVIGIFGPTRPEMTGPRGVGQKEILFADVGCNKSACYHLSCTNNICMQTITVDDVLETIKKFTR